MSSLLLKNIKLLVNVREENQLLRGHEMSRLPVIGNAYLYIENGFIAGYGSMKDLPEVLRNHKSQSDLSGRLVLPGWCDSHTHLVFAAYREEEFVYKLKGYSYEEIAERGGGILHSARKLAETSEEELFRMAWERLQDIIRWGTVAVEIKSGYGLSTEPELKMLRVIKKIKEQSPIPVKATFLGAHAYPEPYRENHEAYLQILINEMLPVIHREKLADYVDVFCEKGFFSAEETRKIIHAAKDFGLKPKLHAHQFSLSGGVRVGVETGALSVDHLEIMDDESIELLASSSTIGTLLPGAAFFLSLPYPPAGRMIEAGCALAIASDFNPGTSPCGNMNFMISLACIGMKMLPEQAINAATLNGAYAMECESLAGSITVGKKANLIITRPVSSVDYLPYAFATNWIEKVLINGEPY
ncbi:MAG: imidazolonepropionase [Chitinophagaceae bacterium]|nr:imidazolonepropionase [Chitinophagaceae bacterium]